MRTVFCDWVVRVALLALGVDAANQAAAQLVHLDLNGATAGSGILGGEVVAWDLTNPIWTTDSTGASAPVPWTGGATAVLSAGNDAAGTPTLTVGGVLGLGGLTIEERGASVTGGTLSFSQALTVSVAPTTLTTISSVLADSSSHALTISGGGTLTLAGTNTYTGTTTINGSSVVLTNAAGLGSSSGNTVLTNNANLQLQGTLNLAEAIAISSGSLNTSGSISLTGQLDLTGSPIITVAGGDLTLAGGVSGTGGIDKRGPGTLVLSAPNTFANSLVIRQGAVVVTDGAALPPNLAQVFLTNQGGPAVLDLQNVAVSKRITFLSAATLSASAGASSNSGNITLTGGSPTFDVSGAELTLSGVISGTGAATLTKTGTGTLILSGANTHQAQVIVAAGTLAITHANALGNLAKTTRVDASGSLDLRGVTGVNEPIFLNGGTLAASTGTNGLSGNLTIDAMSTIDTGAGTLTLSGALLGSAGFSKTGPGTLTIARTNTYSAPVTIADGTLRLSASNAVAATTAVSVEEPATLRVEASQTFASLSGSGKVDLAAGTLTLGGNSTIGILHITGDSFLDFGSNSLTVENFIIDPGVAFTVSNEFVIENWWTDATMTTLVAYNTSGTPPYNQVTFAAYPGLSDTTRWTTDGTISPVPEPGTYGALLLALCAGALGWHRRRQARPPARRGVAASAARARKTAALQVADRPSDRFDRKVETSTNPLVSA